MATYEHPLKCMNCGLHWIVCSWLEAWPEENDAGDTPDIYCPECGKTAGLLRWSPRRNAQEIFQIVPGSQALVAMG